MPDAVLKNALAKYVVRLSKSKIDTAYSTPTILSLAEFDSSPGRASSPHFAPGVVAQTTPHNIIEVSPLRVIVTYAVAPISVIPDMALVTTEPRFNVVVVVVIGKIVVVVVGNMVVNGIVVVVVVDNMVVV